MGGWLGEGLVSETNCLAGWYQTGLRKCLAHWTLVADLFHIHGVQRTGQREVRVLHEAFAVLWRWMKQRPPEGVSMGSPTPA